MATSYLLDTQVLLWSLNSDPRLARHHFEIIEAKENLTISVVTTWEIAIKRSLGKLTTHDGLWSGVGPSVYSRLMRFMPSTPNRFRIIIAIRSIECSSRRPALRD